MPYRHLVFANNEIYHILNRGVAQAPIFLAKKEYERFLLLLAYYRFTKPLNSFSHFYRLNTTDKTQYMDKLQKENPKGVEILAYCLMPNHFHLLIKQKYEGGITHLLSNMQNGYVRFFNLRHHRIGPLFQSMFKAIRIESDEQLLHTSRYIHLNPVTSFLIAKDSLSAFPWSSYSHYLEKNPSNIVDTVQILALGGGRNKYERFVLDQVEYQQQLHKIKHLLLEKQKSLGF